MLTNGQFFSSFVFTLYVIGVLVALFVIGFVAVQVWQFSQPLRNWLQRNWVARLIRTMGTILKIAMAHVKSFIKSLLAIPVIRPWQAFITLLTPLGNLLRKVPWDICIGISGILVLPFLIFALIGMPLRSIIGVAAAGALIGVFCAPFTGWRYRPLGPSKAIGISLLTIAGGAWVSVLLIATLIVMASD